MVRYKYFYYLLILNALTNIVNFVPRTLLRNYNHGMMTSILLSTILGSILVYTFIWVFSRYPQQGLAEVLVKFPRFRKIGIPMFSLLWFWAGMLTLLSFVNITNRYVAPDIPLLWIMIGFLLIVLLCARMSSASILYMLEILILVNLPLVAFTLYKFLSDEYFLWDAVKQVAYHSWGMPRLSSIGAGTFIFSGYANMIVFNRVFTEWKLKRKWLIVPAGIGILLSSSLIPIGYFGTIAAKNLTYPWMATSDAVRLDLFVVERMVYLFYIMYISIALVSISLHWHVGLEMVKECILHRTDEIESQFNFIVLPMLAAGSLVMLHFYDERKFPIFGQWFLNTRLLTEAAMLVFLSWLMRKGAKHGDGDVGKAGPAVPSQDKQGADSNENPRSASSAAGDSGNPQYGDPRLSI